MKKNSNLGLIIISSFFAGNIILLGAYILVYIVSKEAYYQSILNLTNFRNLLLQLIGSGLLGCLYTLVIKYFIDNEKEFKLESTDTKDMFKEACKKGVKLLWVVILIIVVLLGILNLIVSNSMTETMQISFLGAATIAMIIWAIGYIGISTKKELNKKLEERKIRKQENV